MSGIIPIRCFSCGSVIANKWEKYITMIREGIKTDKIFKLLGIRRYCCRRMFLGHIDLHDKLNHYVKT